MGDRSREGEFWKQVSEALDEVYRRFANIVEECEQIICGEYDCKTKTITL